jgi:fructuronate reductase
MESLSLKTLAALPASVAAPSYDLTKLKPGILHLGIGAFHRAHQAVYTDTALADSFGPWGIIGVSLRQPEIRNKLIDQDYLYAVIERNKSGEKASVIGAVRNVLFAPENISTVLDHIARPDIRIISTTVTEKGYCHHPATGELKLDHPEIEYDLHNLQNPKSTIGVIAAGLYRRMINNAGRVTILCCDNLPQNGKTVAGLVKKFSQLSNENLATWIDKNVTFPSTMVDRIVPAATDNDVEHASSLINLHDHAPVICEPFKQWVIEDKFAGGRPAWEKAGAEFVNDVLPYEEMKLRLLNASHSALAYLGYLAGFTYIYEVVAVPAFEKFIRSLMNEDATPTLHLPNHFDLTAYKNTLIQRFANPALAHRCKQIAMDGSQKLPQRMLATARERLATGASCRHIALAIAGWIRYVSGKDEKNIPIEVADPFVDEFKKISSTANGDIEKLVEAYLNLSAIFGTDFKNYPGFVKEIKQFVKKLYEIGSRATVESLYTTG